MGLEVVSSGVVGEVGLLEILGLLTLGGEKGSLDVMDSTREVFRGEK